MMWEKGATTVGR